AAHPVRRPHVGIEPRDLEIRRENADDLVRKAIEHKGGAKRIARASETPVPEAMTNQDQPLPLLNFFGGKATSLYGLDAEERKQVGRNARAGYLFRPVGSGQRSGRGVERGDVREAL